MGAMAEYEYRVLEFTREVSRADVRRLLAETPGRLTATGGLLCEIGAGRDLLERDFPHLPFFWLDTETSQGEVFWLPGAVLEEGA